MEGKITKTGVMIHYVSFLPYQFSKSILHAYDIIFNPPLNMQDSITNNRVTKYRTDTNTQQVIDVVDMGDPILQIEVPLTHPEDDDIGALKERIHGIEHGAIVEGTKVAIEKIWEDMKTRYLYPKN